MSQELKQNLEITTTSEFYFETFTNENDLESIIKLVEKDLSEPYSIYTYRFFIYDFPKMCIMVRLVIIMKHVIIKIFII